MARKRASAASRAHRPLRGFSFYSDGAEPEREDGATALAARDLPRQPDRADLGSDQTLTVTVVAYSGSGRAWTGSAAAPVHLIPFRPLQPRLVAPLPGAHVGDQTTIEGYNEP